MWSATAGAQATKFTGTCACKTVAQHALPVGDRPDHNLGADQYKCDWTKPFDLGGDKTKEGVATDTFEGSGNKGRFHGIHVVTLESGTKISLPYQGTSTNKDGKPVASKGTFTFADGRGKLKGTKGKGTFSCTAAGDVFNCDVEGEYQLAK
ncbi:MAG TPA: hypothetical protein VEJ86_08740 [Candidatus Binataceae bacterium]|nr:hypothetical protein [Candidatus Binataceae bacterium]